MSNLTVIENVSQFLGVETKLVRMKELRDKIKELTAEKNMLEEQVIKQHFLTDPEYKTSKGLLLATYTAEERVQFNSKDFKEQHKSTYDLYSTKNIVHVFRLK